ncbi:hypothetical protein [Micromonospora sp. NPDC023633]|uniref:hypothetical protein n=1 Tax=Micromonospora sp. NPDC023633 TaxID=3154320 RepID=UPI0033D944A2
MSALGRPWIRQREAHASEIPKPSGITEDLDRPSTISTVIEPPSAGATTPIAGSYGGTESEISFMP